MDKSFSLQSFFNHIMQSIQKAHNILKEDLSIKHISINQLLYIDKIYKLKSPTVTELAKELGFTKPSVTVIIEKLEKEKIVIKLPSSADKRSYNIRLTDKGKDIAQKHEKMYEKTFGQIEKILNENEKQQLHSILIKVFKYLK